MCVCIDTGVYMCIYIIYMHVIAVNKKRYQKFEKQHGRLLGGLGGVNGREKHYSYFIISKIKKRIQIWIGGKYGMELKEAFREERWI